MDYAKEPSRVTLMDIAMAADCSVKTVSLALRAHPSVAKDTADRIHKIAKQLGYRGKKIVKTQVIGLIAPYISHIAYGEVISAIRSLASSYGFLVLIGETGGEAETEMRLIDELTRRGTAGLVLIGPRIPHMTIENLARSGQEIVTINTPVGATSPFWFGSVEVDYETGACNAVKYLIDAGHRRIAYLAGRPQSITEQQRRRGYLKALSEVERQGYEPIIVDMIQQVIAPWPTFRSGYDQCRLLLSRTEGSKPDAIVVYNDVMALGTIRVLREYPLRVPEDISVVGFDNLSLCQFSTPSLSSVGVQWEKIALWVVNLLFEENRRRGKGLLFKNHHVFLPEFFIRESVSTKVSTPKTG